MRIIPKKTKVRLEFFKGIGIMDMVVALIGGGIALSVFLSEIPGHFWIGIALGLITIALVFPIEDDRGYLTAYSAILYFVRYKSFTKEISETDKKKKNAEAGKEPKTGAAKVINDVLGLNHTKPTVYDITPFTGVNGNYIEYGKDYFGVAVEIPSVEFKFFTEGRQDNVIDRVYGSVLRTIAGNDSAEMIKIERPINYDAYIVSEEKKIKEIKEAYLDGLLTEEELTKRVAIIEDRKEKINNFNKHDKIYDSFHYIVFYGTDKKALLAQAYDMCETMLQADMECHVLSEKELVVFLKYNYGNKFDEREVNKLSPDKYMDWILPDKIEFTPRQVRYDGLITHNMRVKDFPTVVANAWAHQLFNIPETRAVMKIRPVDRYKAIRQIDRALEEVRSQYNDTGKASKSMELQTHYETLTDVLSRLQGDNETLFEVNVYMTVYDEEMTKREEKYKKHIIQEERYGLPLKKKIKRIMSEDGFKSNDLLLQQFEAYASAAPSAYDAFSRDGRGIHSSSVAASFPYVYKTLQDKGGVCLGESNGLPVFIDFFKRDRERVNSNVVIIGKSGSGKSYATKTLLANLAAENAKIFILDPENEYYEMAKNFDGKIIDVGSATQGRLNPFHIISSLSDEEEEFDEYGMPIEKMTSSYNVHLQFLEEFFTQILPEMDADAKEYLHNIIVHMYDEKGIDEYTDLAKLGPEDYPTFDDLYGKILDDYQASTGEYSKNNLRTLLNYISKFASGGRNSLIWNGPASVNTDENFIVFNFQSLLANKNNTVANAQMLLVLKYVDNEIIKNRDYNIKHGANRKIIVVIDEAHVFIDAKYPIALDFMYQLAKRIRKYNGMQIIITQNVRDFVDTQELARKSTAIINASQYSFIFPLAPNDMNDLCKLYEKASPINESEQEDIINNGRGRAFVVTSPSERTNVSIVADEGVERLFTI